MIQCDNCAKCPVYCDTVFKARLNMCDKFVMRVKSNFHPGGTI